MADTEDQNDILAESQNIMETVESKENTSGITIEVINPKIKDDTFNKYVSYTIKGVDKNGPFEVVRRYSDFDKVRGVLLAKWPGCYIPPLPPKALNSLDSKFVKERRRYLHFFCQKVAALPNLHYFPAYQEFLRSKQSNLEKVFQPWMKTDYEEIITRYETAFPELKGKDFSLTIIKKISEFKTFLKKVKAQTENVRKYAKFIVKAKNDFYQQFAFMNGLVSMEYEKNVFSQYHGKGEEANVFFGKQSSDLMASAEKIETASKQPSFEYLTEWYKAELREFDALIDAVTQQENYVNLKLKATEKQKSTADEYQKVLSGKSTMKGVLFRKNKDDEVKELETKAEKAAKELDQLTALNEMITLILGYDEIDKFKNNKMKPYYNCIRASAKRELDTLANMEAYWKTVLENKNIESLSNEEEAKAE